MLKNNLLIFGYGYCASAFISKFKENINNIFIVTRNKSNIQKLNKRGINACIWSNKSDVKKFLNTVDTVLISVPPNNITDPVINSFSEFFLESKIKLRLIYLSSTGVYGDHKGNWVSEVSKLKPTTELGIWRLNAENAWLSLTKLNKAPLSILRLSGIYGPGRSPFNRIKDKSFRIIRNPHLFFSRIHVDDIVNIIFEFLKKENINGIYNITDNTPATSEEVYFETFKLLRLSPPPSKDISELNLSKTAKGFFSESKKVSNKKLLNTLDYKFLHPDYKSGLKDIYSKLDLKSISN